MQGDKSLLKNAGVYVFGSFFVQGLSFVTLPVFSALMPPEDYGLYASYVFWTTFANSIIGLQTASSVNNAYIDFGKDRIYSYAFSTTPIAFASFAVVSVLCGLFPKTVTSLLALPLVSVFAGLVQSLLTFFFNTLINIYRIEDKPFHYLLLSMINAIVGVFGSIILLLVDAEMQPYATRVTSSLIAAVLTGGMSFFVIKYKSKDTYKKAYSIYAAKLTAPLVFHALAGMMLARINQMMLLNLIGEAEAGIYAYAANYGQVISTLFLASNAAFVPWFYKSLADAESFVLRNVVIKGYVRTFVLGACAYMLFCPFLISTLSSDSYDGASIVAAISACSFIFNFLYTIPANYEFYQKKTSYIAVGTVISCLINIALCVIFIPNFGSMGAAYASLISYIFLFLGHSFIVSRVLHIQGYVGLSSMAPWGFLALLLVVFIQLYLGNRLVEVAIGLVFCALMVLSLIRMRKKT